MLDMKIEDYRITSDSRNIVLSKVRRDEEGNIATPKQKKNHEQILDTSKLSHRV